MATVETQAHEVMNRVYSKQTYKILLEQMLKSMRVAELIRAERFDTLKLAIDRERQRGVGLGIQFRDETSKQNNLAYQPGIDVKLKNSAQLAASQRVLGRGLEEYLKELQHVYSIKERQLDEGAYKLQEELKVLQGKIDRLEMNQMNEMKVDVLGRQVSQDLSQDTSLQRSHSEVNSLIESISVQLDAADYQSRVLADIKAPNHTNDWSKKKDRAMTVDQNEPMTDRAGRIAFPPVITDAELEDGFRDFLRRKELRESVLSAKQKPSQPADIQGKDRLPISQISLTNSRYSNPDEEQDNQEIEMRRFGINSEIESISSLR